MIAESLKDEFEKTAKVLDRMFTAMKDFQQVHTNDFMRLYNKKQEVERSVLVTLIEYDNQKQLEKQIEKETEKLSAAIQTKSFHEKFESIVEITEPVPTKRHNTICGHPGCYSNCHVPCSLDKSFNKEAFLSCWCIDGETCHVCGHDYRVHYHDEIIFEKKTKKAVDEKTKKKYEDAKSAEDKARIQKQQLEKRKIECEKEKKRLSQQLVTAMEEFETLGITRSYLILLENQLYVIELYLKAEEGNKAPLQKTKADLEKRITVVKESIR